ncbi:MAG: hydroxyacid dehydrogenase [Clostridiaceae bacterium]|nr:hydroxyacid dehydrogenase [Clostridiaceae bacterium]
MNIVIMESLGISQEELNERKAPFERMGCTFKCFEKTTDIPTLIDRAKDADAIILANMPLPEKVINSCPQLKFIDIAFTGVDHVAMGAVRKKNIVVSNAAGYSNDSVAELGVGLVLGLLRNIPQVEQRCRNGLTKDGLVGHELKGKTIGIIGLGKIGKRSAELYHAFGCKVLANSRSIKDDCPNYISQVSRDELLSESDIVLLHCPLNESTRGMINSAALSKMKTTAILVNLARGPVVVAKDLADALNNDVIAGAAIDVFDKEPPLDADEPLLHAKNTIVTPHIAFATKESMSLRAKIVFDNLKAWMDGKPQNVVNQI